MTEQELRDYQMWTFEDLAEYLLKAVFTFLYNGLNYLEKNN